MPQTWVLSPGFSSALKPIRHTQIQELHYVLRTETLRIANLLNESTPTYRLPPELLTKIFDLSADHGSAKQIIPLTHVCRYWRTLLLSYPMMWSTLYMKPGDPNLISEWLARSHKVPLTVIAEFTDSYEHPPCRYQDSATASLADGDELEVCSRHKAVLSLDKLLPHRSRIRNLDILFHSSDPDWNDDDHDDEPTLLYHLFFKETLPNLQRLDFRATHVENDRYMIPIPGFLFAKKLPRLKELKYLGVTGGLTRTVKDLTLCEIGYWSESAGPTLIDPEELSVLFSNNKSLKSLTLNWCQITGDSSASTPTSMMDLEFFKIDDFTDDTLQKILHCIQIPQFKNLDTIHVSLHHSRIHVVTTNGSGHAFEFSQFIRENLSFHPLRHLGADIILLHLDRSITLNRLDDGPALYTLFRSLGTVQVLEFDGTITDCVQNVLSAAGIFPALKVIRVAVSLDDCERTLYLLAAILKLRVEEGNPLTTVERFVPEGGDESDRLRSKWKERYKVEGVQDFLSK